MKRLFFLNQQSTFYPVIWTLLAGALVIACSKTADTPVAPTSGVTILSIDPATGPAGTVVTITGSGFSAIITDNIVKFNGITAVVQTAMTTKLTVVAPATGQTGAITVQNGSQTVSGSTFTYQTSSSTTEPIVTTFAGSGVAGYTDGATTTAQFNRPNNIAVDPQGNVYVTDYAGSRIRKITPAGVVSTFAGTSANGYKDGKATEAQFFNPGKMVFDAQGNMFVCDATNVRIRKITPAGDVTTVAGNGSCGSTDGPAASASFCGLGAITVAPNGDLYICDSNNFRIRKISGGQVTTVAGSNKSGYADGTGTAALFTGSIVGITIDSKGNLYIGDTRTLRKITPQGVVSTFVGANTNMGNAVEGTGSAAVIGNIWGMAIDPSDNIYAADFDNDRIWKITSGGVATTITGGTSGYKNSGKSSQFNTTTDVARDNQGILYVPDINNNVIRKIVLP